MLNEATSKTLELQTTKIQEVLTKLLVLLDISDDEEIEVERIASHYPFEGFTGIDSKTQQEIGHTLVEDYILSGRTILRAAIYSKRIPDTKKIETSIDVTVQIPQEELDELYSAYEQRVNKGVDE